MVTFLHSCFQLQQQALDKVRRALVICTGFSCRACRPSTDNEASFSSDFEHAQCCTLYYQAYTDELNYCCAAADAELFEIPDEASEMPQQAAQSGLVSTARDPGQRGLQQTPLLATTGNDLSSKESVDMPMHAFTNPQVHRVSTASSLTISTCEQTRLPLYSS